MSKNLYTNVQDLPLAQDPEQPLLSVQVRVDSSDPGSGYKALAELLGSARYNGRPYRLDLEIAVTPMDLEKLAAAGLNPMPAYHPVESSIVGPLDLAAEFPLLEQLMEHIEELTDWQILTKVFDENLPFEKRHNLYVLAARRWIQPDDERPDIAAFAAPNDMKEIRQDLADYGLTLEELFPDIHKDDAAPAAQRYAPYASE